MFVIRRDPPYKSDQCSNKDFNTIGANRIFTGLVIDEFKGPKTIAISKEFSYDIVEHIDSPCYILTIVQGDNKYAENWREPTIEELEVFISTLIDSCNYNKLKSIEKDICYHYYLRRKRENNIDIIL